MSGRGRVPPQPALRAVTARWQRRAATAVRARGVAATLVGLVTLAGCGLPDNTPVRVDGPLPEAGSTETGDPSPPPSPDEATSETQLVEYFLQAAAGDPEDPVEQLRAFVHSDEQARWQPGPEIIVVDLDETVPTDGGDRVRIRVTGREIGVLTEDGAIEPREGETIQQTLEVVEETGGVSADGADVRVDAGEPQFRLVDPPDEILLSTEAFEDGYLLPRPVYFWDNDNDVLVPDLRWLPSALSNPQKAQQLMEWLADGPAPWLQGALADLPEDVALAGNVVWEDELVVSLTAAASEVSETRLDAQLWWTLREEFSDDVDLVVSIDGEERVTKGDYRAQNRSARDEPARFAVLDGVVRQLQSGDELTIEALTDDANSDVDSAAISRDGRTAALVVSEPEQPAKLVVARPKVREVELPARELGRPVWLSAEDAGLIVGDGELFRFARSGEADRVSVPGDLGELTAVAVSPDARRLALVAGGQLYVASLVWRDGSFSVNEPRKLATTSNDLAGVAFFQENWLAIVGQVEGQFQLYEISVDGAHEVELPNGNLGEPASVDNFVAYPGDPTTARAARGDIMYEMYETENRAYIYRYANQPNQIVAEDLYGELDEDPGDPRAPFFVD